MAYVICEKCGGYYKLEEGESPDNFKSCECGGNLKYVQNLNSSKDIKSNHRGAVKICSECGGENVKTSKICVFCGKSLKSKQPTDKKIKWISIGYGALFSIIITLSFSLYLHFTNTPNLDIPSLMLAIISPFIGGLIAAYSSNTYKNGLLNGIFSIFLLITAMLIFEVIFSKSGLPIYTYFITPLSFVIFGVTGSLISIFLKKKVFKPKNKFKS